MTFEQFDELTAETWREVVEMRNTKGREYAKTSDRLANFKAQAEDSGVTPLQAWHVFFSKHTRAINSYVRDGCVYSEPIHGRFVDAITYLLLGLALIEESEVEAVMENTCFPKNKPAAGIRCPAPCSTACPGCCCRCRR